MKENKLKSKKKRVNPEKIKKDTYFCVMNEEAIILINKINRLSKLYKIITDE